MTNHENAANEVRKAFTEAGVEFEAFETPAKHEFGTTGHFAYVVAGAKASRSSSRTGTVGSTAKAASGSSRTPATWTATTSTSRRSSSGSVTGEQSAPKGE